MPKENTQIMSDGRSWVFDPKRSTSSPTWYTARYRNRGVISVPKGCLTRRQGNWETLGRGNNQLIWKSLNRRQEKNDEAHVSESSLRV
jgi:hypothetical protein